MIYCVLFEAVHAHLASMGFREVGRGELFRAYEGPDGSTLVIRPPNVHGYLPEAIVNLAFDGAGMEPPTWTVFWGD